MRIETPRRVTRTATQTLHAEPDVVFPLYCPVRELDWVAGWDPVAVWTGSGVVEEGCVFLTRDEETEAVWIVTVHDPEAHRVEMIKTTPGVTVCRLVITLRPIADDQTAAIISYQHTSLGPEGDRFLETFTEEFYRGFMRHWEAAMNHYLEKGTKLSS